MFGQSKRPRFRIRTWSGYRELFDQRLAHPHGTQTTVDPSFHRTGIVPHTEGPLPNMAVSRGDADPDTPETIDPVPFRTQFMITYPNHRTRPTLQVQYPRLGYQGMGAPGWGREDSPYDDENIWIGERWTTDGRSGKNLRYFNGPGSNPGTPRRDYYGVKPEGTAWLPVAD